MTDPTPPMLDSAAFAKRLRHYHTCIHLFEEDGELETTLCPGYLGTGECELLNALLAAAESGLAASRPAPPVKDGEVARICDRIESKERDFLFRNDQRGATLMLDARSLLLSLFSRLAAAEARTAEKERGPFGLMSETIAERDSMARQLNECRDALAAAEARERRWYQADGSFIELSPEEVIEKRKDAARQLAKIPAMESCCAALRERVGALTEALRESTDLLERVFPSFGLPPISHQVVTRSRALLSAAPAAPQPTPATAMPEGLEGLLMAAHEAAGRLDQIRGPNVTSNNLRMFAARIEARYAAPAPAGGER